MCSKTSLALFFIFLILLRGLTECLIFANLDGDLGLSCRDLGLFPRFRLMKALESGKDECRVRYTSTKAGGLSPPFSNVFDRNRFCVGFSESETRRLLSDEPSHLRSNRSSKSDGLLAPPVPYIISEVGNPSWILLQKLQSLFHLRLRTASTRKFLQESC